MDTPTHHGMQKLRHQLSFRTQGELIQKQMGQNQKFRRITIHQCSRIVVVVLQHSIMLRLLIQLLSFTYSRQILIIWFLVFWISFILFSFLLCSLLICNFLISAIPAFYVYLEELPLRAKRNIFKDFAQFPLRNRASTEPK